MKFITICVLALAAFVSGEAENISLEDNVLLSDGTVSESAKAQGGLERIVGGSLATINQYPYSAALLFNHQYSSVYTHWCGGVILTTRAILSVARCFQTNYTWHQTSWWRARVGSSFSNSGGSIYEFDYLAIHPNFRGGEDNDIALLRTRNRITLSNSVAQASIAPQNFNLRDNEVVWASGWGAVQYGGQNYEQLRHVQIWTINQTTCRQLYGNILTDRMVCAGWLNVGGRGQCSGDYGSPLLHNGVVVGLYSWGYSCGLANAPSVNTRISSFTNWIVSTANSF